MPDKHTPGPWRLGPQEYFDGKLSYCHVRGPGNELVALAAAHDVGAAVEANAHLLAAAPTLLAALEALHAAMTDVPAKQWLHLDADTGERLDAALEAAWAAIAAATTMTEEDVR